MRKAETDLKTSAALGVIGGLGPLASSEFIKTVYEHNIGEREQESPVVILHSDPTLPDRTEELLKGNCDGLFESLVTALRRLADAGASRVVICCVTLHYLLPRLPADLKEPVISLVDVTLEAVYRSRGRHLLVCSTGTRKLAIFESNEKWSSARDYVVLPEEDDQQLIHNQIIYQIKKNRPLSELTPLFERLLSKYGTSSFIAGCTELHLLAKHISGSNGDLTGYRFIDPLDLIAREYL